MMNKLLQNQYAHQIELKAWDIAIDGMTHSRLVRGTIRTGAKISREVDWKKDPRLIGLVATGGLLFGSGLSLVSYLLH